MGRHTTFHTPPCGADLLAWRKTRQGGTEIIYDDGVARRMVWRVADDDASEARISAALRAAASSVSVVPTLYDELRKRAIAIRRVSS